MLCRGLMLALHRAGHFKLPPVRQKSLNPLVSRLQPQQVDVDHTEVRSSLGAPGRVDLSATLPRSTN
jgi:hypothetical protein